MVTEVELGSFLTKFKQLCNAGLKASLQLNCLSLDLGNPALHLGLLYEGFTDSLHVRNIYLEV